MFPGALKMKNFDTILLAAMSCEVVQQRTKKMKWNNENNGKISKKISLRCNAKQLGEGMMGKAVNLLNINFW